MSPATLRPHTRRDTHCKHSDTFCLQSRHGMHTERYGAWRAGRGVEPEASAGGHPRADAGAAPGAAEPGGHEHPLRAPGPGCAPPCTTAVTTGSGRVGPGGWRGAALSVGALSMHRSRTASPAWATLRDSSPERAPSPASHRLSPQDEAGGPRRAGRPKNGASEGAGGFWMTFMCVFPRSMRSRLPPPECDGAKCGRSSCFRSGPPGQWASGVSGKKNAMTKNARAQQVVTLPIVI